jgi:hypothetical protein
MPATRRAHSPNDGPLLAALRFATTRPPRETGLEAVDDGARTPLPRPEARFAEEEEGVGIAVTFPRYFLGSRPRVSGNEGRRDAWETFTAPPGLAGVANC